MPPVAVINERWWAERVDVMPNGCWLWKRATNHNGYGICGHRRKAWLAHRFSWAHHRGPIPQGKEVCHDCDRFYPPGDVTYRRCVNPAHIFLGTHQENMTDQVMKGRTTSVLTERDVPVILARHRDGETIVAIAAALCLSEAAVRGAVKGRTWSHLDVDRTGVAARNLENQVHRGSKNKAAKLTESQVAEIRAARGQVRVKDLATKFGVSKNTINNIVTGHNWRQPGTSKVRLPQPRGDGHYNAKLTEAQALAIRNASESSYVIGARYGVSSSTVLAIKNGRAWAYLSTEVP